MNKSKLNEKLNKLQRTLLTYEEMSELTKELCKYFRAKGNSEKLEKVKKDIIEETADVLICAETLRLMFGGKEVDEMIEYKIKRWQKRCEEKRLNLK